MSSFPFRSCHSHQGRLPAAADVLNDEPAAGDSAVGFDGFACDGSDYPTERSAAGTIDTDMVFHRYALACVLSGSTSLRKLCDNNGI